MAGGDVQAAVSMPLPDELTRTFKQIKDATKADIVNRMRRCRRPPGHAVLVPELRQGPVTDTAACPAVERARRALVQEAGLYVRVLLNGKDVGRTPIRRLSDQFEVSFVEQYNVRIAHWPQSIAFQLWEAAPVS
jgi:hypothetical protein